MTVNNSIESPKDAFQPAESQTEGGAEAVEQEVGQKIVSILGELKRRLDREYITRDVGLAIDVTNPDSKPAIEAMQAKETALALAAKTEFFHETELAFVKAGLVPDISAIETDQPPVSPTGTEG